MQIHHIHIGQCDYARGQLFGASIRIKRDATVDRCKWVPNDAYAAGATPCLAVPAALWDLLESGLGLREKTVRCRKCGAIEQCNYYEPTKSRLLKIRFCFNCDFWLEKAKRRRKDPNFCVIAGVAYSIGDERKDNEFRGFGGAPHTIRFFDGRVVHSTNLWFNGEVPEHWRAFLPDTAEFVQRGKPTGDAFVCDPTFDGYKPVDAGERSISP